MLRLAVLGWCIRGLSYHLYTVTFYAPSLRTTGHCHSGGGSLCCLPYALAFCLLVAFCMGGMGMLPYGAVSRNDFWVRVGAHLLGRLRGTRGNAAAATHLFPIAMPPALLPASLNTTCILHPGSNLPFAYYCYCTFCLTLRYGSCQTFPCSCGSCCGADIQRPVLKRTVGCSNCSMRRMHNFVCRLLVFYARLQDGRLLYVLRRRTPSFLQTGSPLARRAWRSRFLAPHYYRTTYHPCAGAAL